MEKFDLETYVTVEERIKAFYTKFAEGRIETELLHLDGFEPENSNRLVVIKASIYIDQKAVLPLATGIAKEKEGTVFVNKTSFVENCETSAIGRALANAGFLTDKRPSREEMESVERQNTEHRTILEDIKKLVETKDENIKNAVRRQWKEAKEDINIARKILNDLDKLGEIQ